MLYTIITANNITELKEKVNASIDIGFIPLGGVTINDRIVLQAMLRDRKPRAKKAPAVKKPTGTGGTKRGKTRS